MALKNKIILIWPRLIYCQCWTKAYRRAFESMGFVTELVDPMQQDFTEQIVRAVDDTALFFLGWAEDGFKWKLGDENLFDAVGVPLVSVLIDHLEYNLKALVSEPVLTANRFLCGLYDESDARLAERDPRLQPVKFFFLPNFGVRVDGFDNPDRARQQSITFCGSIPDYDHLRRHIKSALSKELSRVADSMIELLLTDERIIPLDALEAVEQRTGRTVPTDRTVDLLQWTSHYVRGYRREKLLRAFAKKGIEIELYCPGADFDRLGLKGAHKNDALDYDGNLRLLTESKITLNTSPLSHWGLTDRLLNAMANGAVALTDTNALIEDCFRDGVELALFSHRDYDAAADRAAALLQDEAGRQDIAANAAAAHLAGHTAEHRAAYLTELFKSVDFS